MFVYHERAIRLCDLSCVSARWPQLSQGQLRRLVAHLHDSLMLSGGGYQSSLSCKSGCRAFRHTLFSCGAGKDCGWARPVVRRRDRQTHRVHGGVRRRIRRKSFNPLRFSGLLLATRRDASRPPRSLLRTRIQSPRVWCGKVSSRDCGPWPRPLHPIIPTLDLIVWAFCSNVQNGSPIVPRPQAKHGYDQGITGVSLSYSFVHGIPSRSRLQ